jgi:uncharacterized protein YutE (UPF0331/DUF86 family)
LSGSSGAWSSRAGEALTWWIPSAYADSCTDSRWQAGELDRLAGKQRSEVERDRDIASSIRYNFIAAIECSIDLANHIISSERYRSPEDYADAFRTLGEEGLIDPDLSSRMGAAARFLSSE